MTDDTSWEKNCQIVKRLAAWAMRQAAFTGVRGVQFEDFFQEASIAWMKAVERYNPSLGVPFAPYLTNGIKQRLLRLLKNERGASYFAPTSLDQPLSEDIATSLLDTFSDNSAPIDTTLIEQETRNRVVAKLSPRARCFIELLESPPVELFEEMKAVIAKAQKGRSMGITRFAPVRISADLIFTIMDAPPYERTKILKEIAHVSKRLSR